MDIGSVIITVGGKGTRLRPITDKIPKPMVVVAGKPILEHIVENFKAAGLKKIILVVNYKKKQIQEYFGDGSKFGVDITYVTSSGLLGSASVLAAKDLILKDEIFVATSGDKIFTYAQIKKVVRAHKTGEFDMTLATGPHKKWGDKVLARLDVFPYKFFSYLERLPSDERQYDRAIKLWESEDGTSQKVHMGKYAHVDDKDDLKEAEKLLS